MHILIIDDDEIIGMLLKHWLHSDALKQHHIQAHYVSSCQEAYDYAKQYEIDIVLMDVNLPEINGVEGTSYFAKHYPNALIIAISSNNDKEIQEKMLQAGAYDYINKPIVTNIFIKRILTYIRILQLRKTRIDSIQKRSLFSENIFNYQISFPICQEDNLAELWDAMLTRFHYHQNIANIHDTISQLYNFGLLLIAETNYFLLILEENDQHLYITLQADNTISMSLCEEFVNNYEKNAYKMDNDKVISIKLDKLLSLDKPSELSLTTEIAQEESLPPQKTVKALEIAPDFTYTSDELEVFKIFSDDETDDFEDELYKLPIYLSKLKNDYNSTAIEQLCVSLEHLSSIMSIYPQLSTINGCLIDFCSIIRSDLHDANQWIETFPLLNSYVEDIITWYKKLFVEGASSLQFMDDSFASNIELIRHLIHPVNELSTVDDIFDF